MRILIVTSAFYPENSPRSFRATELAKEFSRQGHRVTVITPHLGNVHNVFSQTFNIPILDMGKFWWKPIRLKGKGINKLLRRALIRLPLWLFEYPNVQLVPMIRKVLLKTSGYDLLISIAVPHPVHWGVAAARTIKNPIARVWVADCGDPFMGQENDSFAPPFYFKYIEKWWCRKADYISVPTIKAVSAYYPEFKDKIKVIPQGFRFEDGKVKTRVVKKALPEFAYAGVFIPGFRDPTSLLAYLCSLTVDYRFHIFTSTPQLVEPFAAQSRGRIIIHLPIPRDKLLYELGGLDFMVNFENAGQKQTPSKLIDYVIIDKPILSIKPGDIETMVVDHFLQGDYSSRLVIDREQYRIEKVVQQFLALVKTVTN